MFFFAANCGTEEAAAWQLSVTASFLCTAAAPWCKGEVTVEIPISLNVLGYCSVLDCL